jgi:hypothetical protein
MKKSMNLEQFLKKSPKKLKCEIKICYSTKGKLSNSFFKFLTERIVYFLNTVHCYNILEEYCNYEIQIHRALCDFAVEKGCCWLKEGLPPRHICI